MFNRSHAFSIALIAGLLLALAPEASARLSSFSHRIARPARLPIVVATADFAAPYDDTTGADIAAALEVCKPGCRLRGVRGAIYTDTQGIQIGTASDYPQGLVIERLKAHASIPQTDPMFSLNGSVGVTFRRVVFDGLRSQQTDGVSEVRAVAIYVASPAGVNTVGGKLVDSVIRNFVWSAIYLRNAESWTVARNRVSGIGCHDLVQPCPGLSVAQYPGDGYIEGRRTNGMGIYLGSPATKIVVEDNQVRGCTKICIEAFTSNGKSKPAEAWVRDFVFRNNDVSGGMGAGITVNGGHRGVIEGNVSYRNGGRWVHGNQGAGFSVGQGSSELVYRDNVASQNHASGFNFATTGDRLVVEGNRSEGNCKGGLGASYAAVQGNRSHNSVGMRFANNTSNDPGCAIGTFVWGWDEIAMESSRLEGGSDDVMRIENGDGFDLMNLEINGRLRVRSSATNVTMDNVTADEIVEEG